MFRQRAQGGLERLIQSDLTNVLVVAHGGILNQAVRDLLQASHDSIFHFGDTSFAQFTMYRDSPSVVLQGMNLAPHLEADKPSE